MEKKNFFLKFYFKNRKFKEVNFADLSLFITETTILPIRKKNFILVLKILRGKKNLNSLLS